MWWIILGVVVVVIIGIIIASNNGGGGSSSGSYYRGGSGGSNSSSSPLSDRRLKKNILPLSKALNKILALQGVEFEWCADKHIEHNLDTKRHIGFIAQEVEEVIPEIVDTREDGYKSIQYANLVAMLVEAIKDQQVQIDELKTLLHIREREHSFRE